MSKTGAPVLAAKDSFRIGEVAALTRLAPYVLRYWETEFPMLRPAKSARGQRLYRRADVEVILAIKRLLYDEGFTIAGARKFLEHAPAPAKAAPAPAAPRARSKAARLRQELRAVRGELAGLLTLLSTE